MTTPNPHRIDSTAAPATTPDPPLSELNDGGWLSRWKPVVASLVTIAAGLLTVFSPGSWPFIVCNLVIGVGAALGIVSRGVAPKQQQ